MTIDRSIRAAIIIALSVSPTGCLVGDSTGSVGDTGLEDTGADSGQTFDQFALSATAVSSTQIDLKWSPNRESDLAGYKVYRNGYVRPIAMVRTNSYSDRNLLPATRYYYNLTAFDIAGNESGWSATFSATTSPGTMRTLSFSKDVWPILRNRCSGCHAVQAQVATAYKRMLSTQVGGSCDGRRLSVPGSASTSLVYQKITGSQNCGGVMPTSGALYSTDAAIIGAWINQGARNN